MHGACGQRKGRARCSSDSLVGVAGGGVLAAGGVTGGVLGSAGSMFPGATVAVVSTLGVVRTGTMGT